MTGASSGIGKALCLELDGLGARLILSARNKSALAEILAQCKYPDRHSIIRFDLTDIADFEAIAQRAWSLNGQIDVLVNNGGISQRSLVTETSLDVDRKVMDVDYFGAIGLTKAILPMMISRQQGMIVNIASIAGKIGSSMRSAYSGAKHALIGFMDCLRAEIAGEGIRVVNVCPGFVQTNISRNALTGNMGTYDKLDNEIANGMSAADFAKVLIKRLKSSKQEIIIAKGLPKFGYQMRRIFPNFYHWVLPKLYKRTK